MVIGSSYTGNLKAHLTTPTFTKPINTLKEVVESGLEWGMVMYGEEEERMMAQSKDPVISAIWKYKVEEPYRSVPPVNLNVVTFLRKPLYIFRVLFEYIIHTYSY